MDDPPAEWIGRIDRRRVLRTLGGTGSVGLAGCLDLAGDGENDDGENDDVDDGTSPENGDDPASFEVSDVEPGDATATVVEGVEITIGQRVEVRATVTNTGDEAGTETVELLVEGEVTDDVELSLEGGSDETVAFDELATADLGVGDHGYAVRTADDEREATLTVEEEPPEYEPTWESLGRHDVPDWFDDAKLGIFIHWGPYSAPAWAPVGQYAEWYPNAMHEDGSATNEYHEERYGDPIEEFEYRDFVRETDDAQDPDAPENFAAEEWDPERWAAFFDEVGAGYVVPVAEHHDGFPMYESGILDEWNAASRGPERDVVAELGEAVRERGMKFGGSHHRMLNYYDFRETGHYGHPEYDGGGPSEAFVEEWRDLLYELLDHHEPDLLWLDGDWMAPEETWGTRDVVADYYTKAAVEWDTEVVVNDRLGQVRNEHGDFFTPEYEVFDEIQEHKWEATRGIGSSFGYNRQEEPADHLSIEELVQSFVDVVSKNGNLLINVGPTADGRIPEVQKERLRGLGEWLDANGEAIYGTTYWVEAEDETDGVEVRYTTKNEYVYAILFGWPGATATLSISEHVEMASDFSIELLGASGEGELDWEETDDGLVVELPDAPPEGDHAEHAYALRVQAVEPGENAFERASGGVE